MRAFNLFQTRGPLPHRSTEFKVKHKNQLIFVSGSGMQIKDGFVGIDIFVDGTLTATMGMARHYKDPDFEHNDQHVPLPSMLFATNLSPDKKHTIELRNAKNTVTDGRDSFLVTVIDFPGKVINPWPLQGEIEE